MTFEVVEQFWHVYWISYRKKPWPAKATFLHRLLQIHSGKCLQKIDMLDASLIKSLQNQQESNVLCLIMWKDCLLWWWLLSGCHYSSSNSLYSRCWRRTLLYKTGTQRHIISRTVSSRLQRPSTPVSINPLTPTVAIWVKHPVPDRVKPVIRNFWHPDTRPLRAERQSAWMSKITQDAL